jgi:hypothetical protein
MHRRITGECSLPEEPIWDEDGEEVVDPGGRQAVAAVAEIIRSLGYQTGEIDADLEHDSWTFHAKAEGEYIDISVQHLDGDFLVDMHGGSGCLFFWKAAPKARFGRFAEALFERLASDDRFEDIAWDDW